tara:strand:- start:2611 stop:3066 length:456 start_codon:yes stop_codon:yes gene_type:complete
MALTHIGDIPNLHVRDFQRKRVYDSELSCSFWDNVSILPLEEIEQLITDISVWADIKQPTLSVQGHEDMLVAYATATEIVLPFPITQSKPFICHEMSHVINYQLGPADHHGPNFAKTYLEVVRNFIGKEAYDELKRAFDHLRVRYKEVILV